LQVIDLTTFTKLNPPTNHYHAERNHQGLENRLIVAAATQANDGAVHRYPRLGGTLNFYYRQAA
jgi:putative transposase